MDTLTLRFNGQDEDGTQLHELRAAHVAEVLQGLVGLSSDLSKAGVYGDGPAGSEVLVRPPREGSFLIEVVRFAVDHQNDAKALGLPTLGAFIYWSTKSMRAGVKNFEYLPNENVKITWQDDSVDEVSQPAWRELNKRSKKRKRHLRRIMAPLSDPLVTSLDVNETPKSGARAGADTEQFTLTRPDYDAARPEIEVNETTRTFETEAQMSAVDFDNPDKWKVKTAQVTRGATVEDQSFLRRVATGLAIRKTDIFQLKIREDTVEVDGRKRRSWAVVEVLNHRRASHDDDDASSQASPAT